MLKIKTISIFILTALIVSTFGFTASADGAPSLSNESANVNGPHNAVLSTLVNPNGRTTELHFKYWAGSVFKERIYMGVNGTSSVRIELGLINLLEGTNYSFQVVAVNSAGSTSGNTGTFTTPGSNSSTGSNSTSSGAGSSTNTSGVSNGNTSTYSSGTSSSGPTAPSAVTHGPASVSANSAVLNGSINPNNADTKFWFEFGLTQSFGKKTSIELAGSGNSWQLVTGNLSGLESGRTYYYRVVAQNNFGTALGDTGNFTTQNSTGSGSVVSSNSQTDGQVLGLSTTSGNGSGTSVTSRKVTSASSQTQSNPRPSFISLEYSLADNGALVLVANDAKPKPGEEFTYTVVYKNDSQYTFNEANLKMIIPSEADYLGADVEPNKISGSVIEFDLDNVAPGGRGTVSVTVKIKETVKPGVSMIFTSVLGYKDRYGTQLATTSYMTVRAGEAVSSESSNLLGLLSNISGLFWLSVVGLIVLIVLLALWVLKIKRGDDKKTDEEDIFGMGKIPPTFEPVGPASPFIK